MAVIGVENAIKKDKIQNRRRLKMMYGKSIELFLVNGNADSIVTAELSNWNGKAIKIPRIEVNVIMLTHPQ